MNISNIKNSKILKWTLIIGLPTILVAGYYGYTYYKKRKDEKNNTNTDTESKEPIIDEATMQYYRIRMPYITDITTTLSTYLKASFVPYKFISIKTGMDENSRPVVDYNIGIAPTDVQKLEEAISKLKGALIKKVIKEQTTVTSNDIPACLVKRTEVKSFQEFYESVACLSYTTLFGYNLLAIKNIPNIENKITVDELNKVFSRAASKNFNISDVEREELTNILKKAFAE